MNKAGMCAHQFYRLKKNGTDKRIWACVNSPSTPPFSKKKEKPKKKLSAQLALPVLRPLQSTAAAIKLQPRPPFLLIPHLYLAASPSSPGRLHRQPWETRTKPSGSWRLCGREELRGSPMDAGESASWRKCTARRERRRPPRPCRHIPNRQVVDLTYMGLLCDSTRKLEVPT